MSFKKQLQSLITAALALLLASISAHAQSAPTVFSVGLKAPSKIISAAQGSLVVTESGNGPNTGRVSVIDRTGQRRTLIDNLPSAITQLGEAGPSGPSGLDLSGRTLFVVIGGAIPQSAAPRPDQRLRIQTRPRPSLVLCWRCIAAIELKL